MLPFLPVFSDLSKSPPELFHTSHAGMFNTPRGMLLQREDQRFSRQRTQPLRPAGPGPVGQALAGGLPGLPGPCTEPGDGRAPGRVGGTTSPSQSWTSQPHGNCCILIYLPRCNQHSLQSLRATLQASLRTRHLLPLVFKKDSAQFAWQHARS